MEMKITPFFFIFFLFLNIYANAQEDYCAKYLEWTLDCCHKGEFEQAKLWYAVYKDLGCAPKESIEKLLQENPTSTPSKEITSKDTPPKDKIYRVGDIYMVDTVAYTVAYVRDGGKHGLAILNKGWAEINRNTEFYVTQQHLPTVDELDQIYQNRDILRLYNIYWSRTPEKTGSYFNGYYYTKDFSTGKRGSEYHQRENAIILLIHRF